MAELRVRYAAALFDLSMESGNLNEFLDQAVFLRDALQDDECMRVIAHPHISAADKRAFLSNAFAESIHNDLLGFLYLLTPKTGGRVLIPPLTRFIDMQIAITEKPWQTSYPRTCSTKGKFRSLRNCCQKN